MKRKIFLYLTLFLFSINLVFSQEEKKEYLVTGIGFYNLENLFDTLIDPDTTKILQEDFTPKGQKGWTSKRYKEKLENMSKVIADLGTEITPDGLAILGVSEIENKSVLEDLVKTEKLKNRGYEIVHYDSPDKRGIDVGLLYNPKYFKVTSSRSVSLRSIDTTFYTRDQLLVSGLLNGEKIHVIVTHWPSRRGGEKRSRPRREVAADLGKIIIDSLQAIDPNAKIFYLGDLNDDPTDSSVKKHLKGVGKKEDVKEDDMFNTLERSFKKGIGTLAYRDTWNLFDQILITPSLLGKDYSSYKFYKSKIFSKAYLINSSGRYKGYPYRTFAGGAYIGGYSDHFPVYVFLIREVKK
ncbi:MAG: endonuclease/exonuclease/phosphatase family protein [Flavobacteriales bacterium]|nr:endonuclease/exonuclease/phosphatase family protein [Flavobacteriales bacterium]